MRPLLVQSHWSDFDSFGALVEHPELGLVPRAKEHFDEVVLVCGEDPRNDRVHELARRLGVPSFAGDDDDVGSRFAACMEHFGFGQAARALAHHFTVDLFSDGFECVDRGFRHLEEEGTDAVVLPNDFDLRFGADVFTASFLRRAARVADDADAQHRRRLRFTPWAAADFAPDRFELSHQADVPTWGEPELRELRTVVNRLYPERSRKASMPLPGYEQALALLAEHEPARVLDIACGWGDGTALLARELPDVTGADRDPDQIARNAELHPDATFVAGDATEPSLFDAETFDAIVSIHSMEHFPSDDSFLAGCYQWLRPKGRLVLEVPLVMERPFAGLDVPMGDGHVREYRVDSLLELVERWFEVQRVFGVARGLYLDRERARNAVMLELTPR